MTPVSAAHDLYVQHSGRNHRLIEEEMHALGYTTFSRRRFYNHRTSSGKLRLGWIEKFGWRNEITKSAAVDSTDSFVSIRDDSCQFVAKNSSSSLGLCASVVEASLGTTFDIRNSTFESWLPEISPAMRWDWPYQQLIYEKLQAITDGRSKRLMIFLPPRHGKSELVTVRYTAWRLRNDPSLSVILGSYNQRLANRFSRKVRITWEDSLGAQASRLHEHEMRTSAPPPDVRNGSAFPAESNNRSQASPPAFETSPCPSVSAVN